MRSKSGFSPVKIKGIDPSSAGRVVKTLKSVILPDVESLINQEGNQAKLPAIVLAKELANNLGVQKGDIISLISLLLEEQDDECLERKETCSGSWMRSFK